MYLSLIVGCFDGVIPVRRISTISDAHPAINMVDNVIGTLSKKEYPLIHTDRACHYRWSGWISQMDNNVGLVRFMSKKGCSLNNSACEGFFGRVKNEEFYNRSWSGVTIEEFIENLNEYVIWYNESKIKILIGNINPLENR